MALRTNFGLGSAGVPSNLYSGGAVVFNTQPYISYYLQQQAHKQAQEDAFYKYFGELSKSLTPAGMHTKDIPTLMQKKNEWQQFDMQNRKAIARPGLDQGKAYAESMQRYNDMLSLINQSKNDVKNLAALKPILDSPQKNALLNDATQLRIHKGSLPIGHPDYEPFDPSSINFNPPAFDSKQANAMRIAMSQYKPTEGSPIITPIGNNQQQVVHNFKFNPNQLNGIYTQAAVQYHNNPSFQNMIDAQDSPEAYHSMNQQFKEHYGRDINSKEDMSAAYMLSLHPDLSNKVEIRNVPINPWESAAASLGREKQFYDYKEQHQQDKTDISDAAADKWLTDREAEAKKTGSKPYTPSGGQPVNTHTVKLDPDQIKTIFGQRDISGKHMLVPDEVRVLDNGDYLPIYYQYKDGKPVQSGTGNVAVDSRYTKPVSRDAVKASIIQHKIIPKTTTITTTTTPSTHVTQKTTKTTFGSGGLN